MHELSIIKALIQSVKEYQRDEHANQVKLLRIEVGNMTCVDAASLLFCFDMVKQDAGLCNAGLRIDPVQATAKCLSCGHCFVICQVGEPCKCGSYRHELLTGNELNLTEIEFA